MVQDHKERGREQAEVWAAERVISRVVWALVPAVVLEGDLVVEEEVRAED